MAACMFICPAVVMAAAASLSMIMRMRMPFMIMATTASLSMIMLMGIISMAVPTTAAIIVSMFKWPKIYLHGHNLLIYE